MRIPSPSLGHAVAGSIAVAGGVGLFVGRLLYETHTLHLRKEVRFFVVLHSGVGLVYWAALMLFLIAHVWLPMLLTWIVIRRDSWLRLLPVAGAIAIDLVVGWVVYSQ